MGTALLCTRPEAACHQGVVNVLHTWFDSQFKTYFSKVSSPILKSRSSQHLCFHKSHTDASTRTILRMRLWVKCPHAEAGQQKIAWHAMYYSAHNGLRACNYIHHERDTDSKSQATCNCFHLRDVVHLSPVQRYSCVHWTSTTKNSCCAIMNQTKLGGQNCIVVCIHIIISTSQCLEKLPRNHDHNQHPIMTRKVCSAYVPSPWMSYLSEHCHCSVNKCFDLSSGLISIVAAHLQAQILLRKV